MVEPSGLRCRLGRKAPKGAAWRLGLGRTQWVPEPLTRALSAEISESPQSMNPVISRKIFAAKTEAGTSCWAGFRPPFASGLTLRGGRGLGQGLWAPFFFFFFFFPQSAPESVPHIWRVSVVG